MNFFKKLFTESEPVDQNVEQIKVARIQSDEFDINLHDKVNIWNRPDTNEINIYAKGSGGGRGKVGIFQSEKIAQHLQKGGLYTATIVKLNLFKIELEIELIQEFKTAEDYRSEQNERYTEQLKKTYKPKNPWTVNYIIEQENVNKKALKIMTNDLATTINNIDNFRDNIWLVDKDGYKINAVNHSNSDDIMKTLRASFSGHNLVISFKKQEGAYSIFEIKTAP